MTAPDSSAPDTTELLDRARAGDEAAFGALMRLHYEPVFRTVYAMVRNEHDARDVCQEAWLVVWRELKNFRGESKFSTWLHPIAVRKALDHLRKRRRWYDRFLPFATGDEDSPAVAEPATQHTARDDAETSERAARLHRAMEALPPKQRAVLVLRELQGLSYEEIAQAVSLPIGTVMSRLYHARRHLAQRLKESP